MSRVKYKSKDKYIIEVKLKAPNYIGQWNKVVGFETELEAKAVKIILQENIEAINENEFRITEVNFDNDDLMS
ncbi:unnamed protein product [marine sediment metagenome]|uniref:Uncharacterized protein n=1 Tax=marine sediment metagenome TaxID=412755 RepID=X0UT03_9ZZZZ